MSPNKTPSESYTSYGGLFVISNANKTISWLRNKKERKNAAGGERNTLGLRTPDAFVTSDYLSPSATAQAAGTDCHLTSRSYRARPPELERRRPCL